MSEEIEHHFRIPSRYFNPYILLEEYDGSVSLDNDSNINKILKKIIIELDLGDGTYRHRGSIELSKHDLIVLLEELKNAETREYHLYVYKDKLLNDFLTYGSLDFFLHNSCAASYDYPPFILFISPYFASQYDYALKKAVQNHDVQQVQNLVAGPVLVDKDYIDGCYRGTYAHLKHKISAIMEGVKKFKPTDSGRNLNVLDIKSVMSSINKTLDLAIVNMLPQYFQEIRNDFADALRALSIEMYNDYGESIFAYDLMRFASQIRTSSALKSKIRRDMQFLGDIKDQIEKKAGYDAKVDFIKNTIMDFAAETSRAKKKEITAQGIKDKVNCGELLEQVNLPEISLELRDQLALKMVELASSMYYYLNDTVVSFELLSAATEIEGTDKVKENVWGEFKKLNGLIVSKQSPKSNGPANKDIEKEVKQDVSGKNVDRCPNCGFIYAYDGETCSHCNFNERSTAPVSGLHDGQAGSHGSLEGRKIKDYYLVVIICGAVVLIFVLMAYLRWCNL